MSDESLDYEEMFTLYGYETAIKFLVQQAKDEMGAGVDLAVVLIRFHNKASKLRRLEEADKRNVAKRRVKDGQTKKTKN